MDWTGGASARAIPGNAKAEVERANKLVDFADFNSSSHNNINYNHNVPSTSRRGEVFN